MPLPCPFCQRPFAPGATACPACGASLLLESLPGDTRPVCAVHPTLRSLGTCERCGAFACAQCLRPGPQGKTVCANCQPREPDQLLPWDRREELGLVPALWKTLLEVLLRPGTFSQTRAEGRTSESLLFVLLCSIPACFVTGVTYLLLFTFMPALAMELSETNRAVGDATGLAMMRWMGVGMLVTFTLFGPLASVAINVMNAGMDHLVLRAGGVTRPFRVTLRACSLAQAPWILGLVPFLGMQVAPFWALVSRVFAYRGLHRTTTGVAMAGALVAPVASCCLCSGGYFALLLFIFASSAGR